MIRIFYVIKIKRGGLMKGLASNLCKYVACVLLASLLAVGFTSIGMSAENPSTASLIVRIVSGLSAEEQQAVIQRNGGEVKSSIPQMNLYVIEVPLPDAEAVALSYLNDPQVARIELNNTRKVEWLPNDSLLGDQWHLPRIAWDQVYGNAALNSLGYMSRIAVLDTGINAAHSDLANVVVPGMSAFDPESDGTTDPNGHGTWLAGIAAAQTNNGEGIAGVAYSGTEVVPVQVIDGNGEGQDSDIIAGVIWAADHGVDVILMGFSNPGFSENLQLAIDYAWSKDVVLVAAVGNDSLTEPTYPAGDAGVMGVSATDNNDAPAGFSNSGPAVFLAAPGVDIMSTDASQGYLSTSGTSASSAIVAGVAGFMRAVDPTLSNGVIVGRIARNADPAGSADPAEAQLQVGNGRINMARALADTSMEEVKPEGAPGGGPFVGPYGIASVTSVTITSPTSASPISVTSLPSTISVSFNYVTSSTGTTTATVDVLGTSATNSKSLTPGTGSDTVSVDIPAGTANGSYNLKVTVTNSTGTGANNKNDNQNGAVIVNVSSCTVVSIITNPTDQSVVYGNDAIFSAAASGNPTPTVQWQVSTDGGSTWGNVGGAISTTLTIDNPTVSQSGSQYKAVFTNNCGGSSSSTTTAATLTVTPANATCTVSGYSGVYDAASHGASGSCSGIGGEDAGTLDLGDTFKNVPGGTAHWVFTGNGNYNDQSGDVAIAITKADATCSVSGYSGVYDAASHGASGSCSGISGENAGTLDLGDTFKNVPGGTANWVFTGNVNYKDQIGHVDIVISKADPTCTITGYNVVYDLLAHTAAGSCSGVGGDGTLSGLDLSGTTHTNPGDYSEDPWVYTDTTGNYKNASGTVHDNIHYATGGMCLGSPGHAILQPIDADGGSVFKQKSTVPAKFRVCDAFGNSIGTQGVVTGFILEKIMNGTTSYPTESVDSTTPFTEFRWSATDQQWIFNMSTKGLLAGKTYFFEITLNDGSTIEFNFGLK
jgi:subtilisin family serine protease